MAFAACKKKSDDRIITVGYQHAAIFKKQHSIHRSLGAGYDPDIILNAGNVGFNQAKRDSKLLSTIGGVLGSPRALPGLNLKKSLKNRTILVIPEGTIDDCNELFSYSLECARADPSLHFIWRLHPLMDFKKIFLNTTNLFDHPKNIVISNNEFEWDISTSTFVLFRGSTAAISALAKGLIPLYLDSNSHYPLNPIYEIEDRCNPVASTKNLIDVVNKANFDPLVMEYCNNFYSPLTPEPLQKILMDA